MTTCGHCGEAFIQSAIGRRARYCGATCRKKAFDKRRLDEAVTAAMARGVMAERRRAKRENGTGPGVGDRGNETAPATPPAAPVRPSAAARAAIVRTSRRRSGMTASAMPTLWDSGQ
ncbi:hypothetical protein [Streptomyces sp. CAI-85]|uniref:hypothetical protein n=1 Tax=Streptomyces sp. CAI-85 TaxID=1472662 RepID=UPI0015871B73|nr:hypothetical protein [Streptomyces sp. CAI-85]NUV64990.1 hypothetical protein [Streptomyces sp. CAI-85]